MRCRRIKDWTDENGKKHRDVVWFGSVGRKGLYKGIITASNARLASEGLLVGTPDYDYRAIRADDDYSSDFANPHNYADGQEGVACSLIQRLSVLKGELWWRRSYGLPLTDKNRQGDVIDSFIMSTILEHPNVRTLTSFKSSVDDYGYSCTFIAETTFGELELTV